MYIDIHAHLDDSRLLPKLDSFIQNAKEAGVVKVLTAGVNPASNRTALMLEQKYEIVEAALGIYPVDALANEINAPNQFNIDEEIEFIKAANPLAIGEVGLDFVNRTHEASQKETFQKVIKLSEQIKRPLIIHSRKAEQEVIDMLESSNAKRALLHCFCGKKKLAKRAIDLGYSFSIPTSVTRATQFQELIDLVPLSQLFAETDSPYLSPYKSEDPNKQIWNQPAYVVESYKKIAEIKQLTLEETKNQLFMNFQKMF